MIPLRTSTLINCQVTVAFRAHVIPITDGPKRSPVHALQQVATRVVRCQAELIAEAITIRLAFLAAEIVRQEYDFWTSKIKMKFHTSFRCRPILQGSLL